jgi:antitoxin VapB
MAPNYDECTSNRFQSAQYPDESRIDVTEGPIRHGQVWGEGIPSPKPADWGEFFAALDAADVPADFLDERERNQVVCDLDPFAGWHD